MSLKTAALLICFLSLTAAAGASEDLSTAPSARSLLAKAKRKKSEKKGPTVLVLDLSVTDGVHTVSASKSSGGKRGGKARKNNPPATPASSPRSHKKSTGRQSRTEHAPGYSVSYESTFYESYGSGDVDLNKVPTVEERSVEAEELPQGEKDLSYRGYKSASKRPKVAAPKPAAKPASKVVRNPASKPVPKPAPKPAPKPTTKAKASISYTARGGVVRSTSRVRTGFGVGTTRSPRRSPIRSRRAPRIWGIRG